MVHRWLAWAVLGMGRVSDENDRIRINRAHSQELDDCGGAPYAAVRVKGRARANRSVQAVLRNQTPRLGFVRETWTGRKLTGKRWSDCARHFSTALPARRITGVTRATWKATTRPSASAFVGSGTMFSTNSSSGAGRRPQLWEKSSTR